MVNLHFSLYKIASPTVIIINSSERVRNCNFDAVPTGCCDYDDRERRKAKKNGDLSLSDAAPSGTLRQASPIATHSDSRFSAHF